MRGFLDAIASSQCHDSTLFMMPRICIHISQLCNKNSQEKST
jgi:hypothetical protein